MFKEIKPILADIVRLLAKHWVKLALLAATAVWLVILAWPKDRGDLQLIFCDVGQGDAILIQKKFQQVLIDGGPTGSVLDCLQKHVPFFDRTIELVVTTHAQLDHFVGLSYVMKSYNVRRFVYNGFRGESRAWEKLSDLVADERAEVATISAGDRIKLGGVELTAIWPRGSDPSSSSPGVGSDSPGVELPPVLGLTSTRDLNDNSIVLWLRYGDFDALLTGDIGADQEYRLLNDPGSETRLSGKVLDIPGMSGTFELLKVPHHGSRYSSSAPFLEAIKPDLAVIQVGRNSFGHPTAEALQRLEAVGSKILRTDQNGDVVITTDGKTWKVLPSNPKSKTLNPK